MPAPLPRPFAFLKKHPLITLVLFCLAAFLAFCFHAASLEDYEVTWTRNVPSRESAQTLGNALEDLTTWPVFHHQLKAANIRDAAGKDLSTEESKLSEGASVRYQIEPPKKEWKRFEVVGRITEHVRGQKLQVAFESDSTGKIANLFDRFVWSVEILPVTEELKARGFQSIIQGKASGHTRNWRGRVFGKLSPRILMNQVYYLDLVKFGTFERQAEARKNNFAPNYQ